MCVCVCVCVCVCGVGGGGGGGGGVTLNVSLSIYINVYTWIAVQTNVVKSLLLNVSNPNELCICCLEHTPFLLPMNDFILAKESRSLATAATTIYFFDWILLNKKSESAQFCSPKRFILLNESSRMTHYTILKLRWSAKDSYVNAWWSTIMFRGLKVGQGHVPVSVLPVLSILSLST